MDGVDLTFKAHSYTTQLKYYYFNKFHRNLIKIHI